ncbi:putative disease resistance RPP13-like protein 1 [Arachis hypogaea]|uniref:putative disease resistance RPP13-like protein 1 n=1 Tax=Arachis hypogaea TaxID=3818 RepID=UPI0010FC574C|nr:putative disease resistance protein At3g14460 [Arachis hypogaea]XP_025617811.2 putative disease resistance protein At3g14460 [Arachis hypogaea]XP_025617812.2 putative disease resistance protein At3g14460 [Arachis hypogaea]XP_025617813.2 putative disease resistance protein At3g14460 [Arachis hypogaea]XP_025617814.2 putative disease resistance protein At3g14460 [Arachis hypogaea]XP_025617815.2 putative disease resistance protein At3g14460 [Arachis hypogaea]XP_029144674.1 putative disease res
MAAKLEGGAYLSSFVDAVLEKLSPILEDDDFVLEEKDSALELLGRLERSLYDVGSVLDDAELKQFSDKKVKKWLVDLQDALYKADDLLDELSTKSATATQRDPGNSSPWSHYVDSCIEDSAINVMEKTVTTLESVVRRKGYLRLLPKESAKMDISSWRIPSTSLVVSSDIFGRDKDKENIIKLLLDDTCDVESPLTVIPIVGMGGIGKTTLAQLVYSDAKVVGKFDTRAWVCVAENPDPVNVTKTIIGAIDSCPGNMDKFDSLRNNLKETDNFDSLQTNLKEKLTGKTFLVVLDDVWHDRRDMWEDFLKPFRFGDNGSKILLTTRNENVASVFTASNLHYRLSLLLIEDCWSMFLKHSSISTNSKQYATLEQIGRKIVEKCKGLPLAVKTLGGLLRNKFNKGDWENILESEMWELSEDDSKIIPALRVSYHYLPSYLKRCFVYCSLYPEDYEFDKDELILLWIAEDLLQPKENNTLEKIGCAYFDELVARSFFQPSSASRKLFVMHDLMHDLAKFFAGKFYFNLKEFGNRHMIDSKIRHLSYSTTYEDNFKLFHEDFNGTTHMKTFLNFPLFRFQASITMESEFWLLGQQSECLRVLSFKYIFLKSLPDSVGELIYLRYLNLSFTLIETLSESICKLYNLQTLKLRKCLRLKMLPSCMQDLVNLCHLDIRGASRLKEMPKGMSKLKNLNFLSDYIVSEQEENGMRELGTLDNLHGSFCISKLEKVKNSGEALEAKMGNKKHINTLKLKWVPDGDVDDVETKRDILDKLQPHENLNKLSIKGYPGERLPDWLGFSCYSNMTKLSLHCCMNCCELPSLGQLCSLQHLEFSDLDGLEKIDLEFYNKNNGSFQQETPFKSLETLKIEYMYRWREWHFPDEYDGFPQLRILSIRNCPVLSGDLPAHLPALEELTIDRCSELACSLPMAPKLQQLYLESSPVFTMNGEPQKVVISETQLAQSVLECLPHIQPPSVQCLEIKDCRSVISISADYLPCSLQYLRISDCSKLTFLNQLQHKSLREIYVEGCDSLKLLPLGDFPNLKKLMISKCQSMECVVVPQALLSLQYLSISECPSLVSLPALGLTVSQLEELHICDCPEIDCFAEAFLPPSLKKLEVTKCQKLASWITFLNQLQYKSLREIYVEGCDSLKLLPLGDFPNLKKLMISKCQSMECVVVPQALPSLQYLSISDCPSLVSLPVLGLTVPQLEELHICDCPEIDCFAEEFLPPSLKKLEVTKCQKLASWITSKGLQNEGLTHLWLGPCFDVKSFPRDGILPASLERLILHKFPNLETLDCKGLHHLTSLKSLAITDCEKLENVTEEHLLPSIEHIYIGEDCPLRWKLARRDGRPTV